MNALKIILIILVIFLSGCFTKTIYLDDAATQTSQLQIDSLSKKLAVYDVCVEQSDNFMVLVLPNAIFFKPNSANFTQDAYEALNLLFDLTSYYKKSVISVTGFSKSGSRKIFSKTIAVERAHKVVSYLWSMGIDASFIYADAGNVAVASKKNKLLLNDCVVISFRQLGEI